MTPLLEVYKAVALLKGVYAEDPSPFTLQLARALISSSNFKGTLDSAVEVLNALGYEILE